MMPYSASNAGPYSAFGQSADATIVQFAMKGTIEKNNINFVTARANFQRQASNEAFAPQFGHNLMRDHKRELDKKLEDVFSGLMIKSEEISSEQPNKVMVGMGPGEGLIDFLCSKSGEELRELTRAYDEKNKKFLGTKKLTPICSNESANSGKVKTQQAVADAKRLYEARGKTMDTYKSVFTEIFAQSNFDHARAVLEEYVKILGKKSEPVKNHKMSPEPTVRPCTEFNPNADAVILRAAMKGFGTDEKRIINIVTTRANFQRQAIHQAYFSQFRRDLIRDFKSELSGNFKNVVLGLMMEPEKFSCKQLNKALVRIWTDKDTLIEILCSRTGEEMKKISSAYDEIYNKSLANHVGTETSGHFRELLTRICSNERANSGQVNAQQAVADAHLLYEAGENRLGTDEKVFTKLFAQSSFEHLRVVFEEYQKISGNSIEKALDREMSWYLKKALNTIVEVARSPPTYFARRLFKSMGGNGTHDKCLIRVLVSRCEFDLGNIKREYEKLYKKTLLSSVKNDTSGDYKKILCALIGGE